MLPPKIEPPVLAGYEAQRDILLVCYTSPDGTVQETAWDGGGSAPVTIVKPRSRGSILSHSTDPFAPPVFHYRTFSHPVDLAIAVAALKKFAATEVLPLAQITGDKVMRGFATSTWIHPMGRSP